MLDMKDTTMKSFISSTPTILGGMPVIKGTRIPIARIIFLLKEGYTIDNIAEQYPWVKKSAIDGAINEVIKSLEQNKNASQIS